MARDLLLCLALRGRLEIIQKSARNDFRSDAARISGVMAMTLGWDIGCFKKDSSRVIDVDELVHQTQRSRDMRSYSRRTITLSGMVATG